MPALKLLTKRLLKNKDDPLNYTKPHEMEALVRVTSCHFVDRFAEFIATTLFQKPAKEPILLLPRNFFQESGVKRARQEILNGHRLALSPKISQDDRRMLGELPNNLATGTTRRRQ